MPDIPEDGAESKKDPGATAKIPQTYQVMRAEVPDGTLHHLEPLWPETLPTIPEDKARSSAADELTKLYAAALQRSKDVTSESLSRQESRWCAWRGKLHARELSIEQFQRDLREDAKTKQNGQEQYDAVMVSGLVVRIIADQTEDAPYAGTRCTESAW